MRNILIFNNFPTQLSKIIDQINIQLIKQKYNFQSKISIKNYNLNITNVKLINKDDIEYGAWSTIAIDIDQDGTFDHFQDY